MTGQVLTAELARNADLFIGSIALVFVLFDHLSKKADVTALKKDLDLRQGQLLGEVVSDLERAITPLLSGGLDYTLDDDLISRLPAPALDDAARDALTAVIRNNEARLAQIRQVKALPRAIHSLNTAVFWLIGVVAIVAFLSAGTLMMFTLNTVLIWLLLGAPAAVVLAAVIVVAIRQTKVQNAEKQILSTDPQA